MDELEASFHASDDITSLSNSEIIDKLKSDSTVPEGCLFTVIDERLLLYLLQMINDVPKIVCCVCLKRDLQVVCSLEDNVVPQSQFSDLLTDGRVTQLSQLINLMARMKSWHTDPSSKPLSLDVRTAVSILQSAKENMPEPDSEQFRKVDLIIEQLRLLLQKKHGGQYSPELTLFAYMIMACSSAAYNVLLQENILSLPSVSTLKKITRKVDSATNVDNAAYLQLRVSKLQEYERTVILIIDEIYVSKRTEYAGGDVIGLTGRLYFAVLHDQIRGQSLQGYCGNFSYRQTDCLQATRMLSGCNEFAAQNTRHCGCDICRQCGDKPEILCGSPLRRHSQDQHH